jgi:hypothetical protein
MGRKKSADDSQKGVAVAVPLPPPSGKLPSDIANILEAYIASETYFENWEENVARKQREADEDFEKMALEVEAMSQRDDAARAERNRLRREAQEREARMASGKKGTKETVGAKL